MNSHVEKIDRIQVGAALNRSADQQYRYSGLDRTFLVLEIVAAPVLLVLAYFLSGSLPLAISACAFVYALSAFGAGRARTALRRSTLLGTAAVVLGPPGVPIDHAARGLISRLDHYHRRIARVEMWVIPLHMMVFGIFYAYVYAGSNEEVRQFFLDVVGFVLLAVLAAAFMQFQAVRNLRDLTAGIRRTLQQLMDGEPPR